MVQATRPTTLSRGDTIRIYQPHRVVEGKVVNATQSEQGYRLEFTDTLGRYQVWNENDGGSVERIHTTLFEEVSELIAASGLYLSFEEMSLELLNDPDRSGIVFDRAQLSLIETDVEVEGIGGKKSIPGYRVTRTAGSSVMVLGTYRLLYEGLTFVLQLIVYERVAAWEASRYCDKDMSESESRLKL